MYYPRVRYGEITKNEMLKVFPGGTDELRNIIGFVTGFQLPNLCF